MGTFYTSNATKQEVINGILRVDGTEKFAHYTLDHSLRGNQLWVLTEVTNKETNESENHIQLFLLSKCQGDWGYKPMCESMHPYYYDCPQKFLKQAPVKNQEWRDKVLAKAKSKSRKFQTGEIYNLVNVSSTWMEDHGDRVKITSLKPLIGVTSKSCTAVRLRRNQVGEVAK